MPNSRLKGVRRRRSPNCRRGGSRRNRRFMIAAPDRAGHMVSRSHRHSSGQGLFLPGPRAPFFLNSVHHPVAVALFEAFDPGLESFGVGGVSSNESPLGEQQHAFGRLVASSLTSPTFGRRVSCIARPAARAGAPESVERILKGWIGNLRRREARCGSPAHGAPGRACET